MPRSIEYYTGLFSTMKSIRSTFESIWSDVDRFIYGFEGNYDSNPVTGQKRYNYVYDQTASKAQEDATNALVGLLWQQGGRSIRLTPADGLDDSESIEFFKEASRKFVRVLDDPKAKLVNVLAEYMDDALARGGSSVGVYRGNESSLMFKHHAQRFLYYIENADGEVDTICLRSWLTATKAVEIYGYENVSGEVQKNYDSATQSQNEIEILHFIMPNKQADAEFKPFESVHVDRTNTHIVKESFYEYLPVKVARIYKNDFEVYGRSAGTKSINTIKRLNAVMSEIIDGVEKINRPPLGISNNALVGQKVLDISAGAVNMLNLEGATGSPINPISTVGDLSSGFALAEMYRKDILDSYQINKLIDLNNDTTMTATEALILDRVRSTSLGALLSRQINELFTPLIEDSFNLLFNDGFFGYIEGSPQFEALSIESNLKGEVFNPELIPPAIAERIQKGESIYNVEYITPAARLLKNEEANSIVEASQFAGSIAGVEQSVLDNVDPDETIRRYYEIKGVDDSLRTADEVKVIREERRKLQQQQYEQQQQQMQMEQNG